MDASFSEESLKCISEALSCVEQTYPHFSYSVSPNELCAGEGWGQGIRMTYSEGQYHCTHYRERSIAEEVLKDEEDAVTRFIRYCKLTMKQPFFE